MSFTLHINGAKVITDNLEEVTALIDALKPRPGAPVKSRARAAPPSLDPVRDRPEEEPRFAPMYPSWPDASPTIGEGRPAPRPLPPPVVSARAGADHLHHLQEAVAPAPPAARPPAKHPKDMAPVLAAQRARYLRDPGKGSIRERDGKFHLVTCWKGRPVYQGVFATRELAEDVARQIREARQRGEEPPTFVTKRSGGISETARENMRAAMTASWARRRGVADGSAPEPPPVAPAPAKHPKGSPAYRAQVAEGVRRFWAERRAAKGLPPSAPRPPRLAAAPAAPKGSPEQRANISAGLRASWARRRAAKAAAAPASTAAPTPAPTEDLSAYEEAVAGAPAPPARAALPRRCVRCLRVGHVEGDCTKPAPGFMGRTIGIVGDEGAGIRGSVDPVNPDAPAPGELEDGLEVAVEDDGLTDLTDLVDVPDAEPTVFENRDGEQCGFCSKFGHRSTKCHAAGVAPAPVLTLVASVGSTLVTPPALPGPPHPALGKGHTRGKTIAAHRLTRDERLDAIEYPDDIARPLTRGDCQSGPRPCPFVSCAHHLYLDVNDETGAIKLNFPLLEVDEMTETCSLDAADRGGMTLLEVGHVMALTRERIRQLEVRGMARIRDAIDRGKFDIETAPVRGSNAPEDHAEYGTD